MRDGNDGPRNQWQKHFLQFHCIKYNRVSLMCIYCASFPHKIWENRFVSSSDYPVLSHFRHLDIHILTFGHFDLVDPPFSRSTTRCASSASGCATCCTPRPTWSSVWRIASCNWVRVVCSETSYCISYTGQEWPRMVNCHASYSKPANRKNLRQVSAASLLHSVLSS